MWTEWLRQGQAPMFKEQTEARAGLVSEGNAGIDEARGVAGPDIQGLAAVIIVTGMC